MAGEATQFNLGPVPESSVDLVYGASFEQLVSSHKQVIEEVRFSGLCVSRIPLGSVNGKALRIGHEIFQIRAFCSGQD